MKELKEKIKKLESKVSSLHRAVDLLDSDCSCSVRDRLNGHLVDCPVPQVREILNPELDYEA